MTVGERIYQRRKELGLTQEELGKRLGYGKSAVCRVEKEGNNITSDRIIKFANALECSPSYLMGWEDKSTSFMLAIADEEGKRMITSAVTVAEPFDSDLKMRMAGYIKYLAGNKHARKLIQEASQSSDEDIQLATEFLMRLNKKER